MIFISFYIALDGCEEASLYSMCKVQINIAKIITGGEKCLAEVLICSVYCCEVWEVSSNTT